MSQEDNTHEEECPNPEKIVTSEIIQLVLSNYQDGTHEVSRFTVKPATKPGENYGSVLYAVGFHLRKNDNQEVIEELHVMLKVVPKSQFGKLFAKFMGSFVKEINMYETVLPSMEKFQRDKGLSESDIVACWPASYGGKESVFVIVRNLKVDGYHIANRQTGLDFEHSKLVLQQMARFHVVSYAMFQGDRNPILERYSWLKEAMFMENPTFVSKTVLTGLISQQAKCWERVYAESESGDGTNPNPAKTINSNKNEIIKIIGSLLARNKWVVIGHGDCWTNNYLFRYDRETGKPVEVKFIDFQMSRAASLISEIHYFLYTSPQNDLLNERENELVKIYFDEFVRFGTQLGVDIEKDGFTWENFQEELEEFRVFGVIIGLTMVGATCANSEDVPEVENFKIMDMLKGRNNMFDNMMKSDMAKEKIKNLLTVHFQKSQHLRALEDGSERKTCHIM